MLIKIPLPEKGQAIKIINLNREFQRPKILPAFFRISGFTPADTNG
jgi:hypothetical protein